MWRLGLVLALATCEKADRAPAITRPPLTHAKDLFDHPEWIGTAVGVDIVEPLYDAEPSSGLAPGEYDVEVSDVGAQRLMLVPSGRGKLGVLHPPLLVHGKLESSEHGLQIAVDQVAPAPAEAPVQLDHASVDHCPRRR